MVVSFLVVCDAPYFCCESGVQGDQECQGQCIEESLINDGEANCDNASDEGGSGMFYVIVLKKVGSTMGKKIAVMAQTKKARNEEKF